ncbi:hypothetical protein [Paramuribaculum intestinale]|jgi:hypothetical protein|uniref:hypothetical protein n=1 Tax=Paramuribaculum intestinale TaxID=2094151 RepID=UPI0025B13538|nr:hypothetical protein [Paramuribaculum intestinale]
MNKTFIALAAMTAAILPLSSCSDDKKIDVDNINGVYDTAQTTLTYNGVKMADATIEITMKEDLTSYPGNKGEALMVSNRPTLVTDNADEAFDDDMRHSYLFMPCSMTIGVEAKGRENSVTFSGTRTVRTADKSEITYTASGTYSPGTKAAAPSVTAEITAKAAVNGLTGHTFEMELNLTDITYDLEKAGSTLMAGLGVNARDGLKELYGTMIDRCRRATGFDRIRFRFNDDGSLEVSGRNAIGGDYVQQPAASYQILADGTLIILQDATWAEMMTNSMSPTSAARMPAGLYSFRSGSEAITAATFSIDGQRLKLEPVVAHLIEGGRYRRPAEKAFMATWPVPEGTDLTRTERLYSSLQYATDHDTLIFTPCFMATRID